MGEETRRAGAEEAVGAGAPADVSPAGESPELVPSVDAAADDSGGGRPRRPRRRWLRGISRAVFWTLFWVGAGGVAYLAQTQDGQRIVLDRLLDIARGQLAGELTVEDIRSRTLFTGMTLVGVRLDAAGGRRFLVADSVVVRYTPFSLLAGSPRVQSTTLHGVDVEVSRYPGEDDLNVSRLLAPGDPDAAGTGRANPLGLGRISIRGGDVAILTPADEATAAPLVQAPTGEPLRRLALGIDDLDVEETVLRPGGAVELDARLTSLSATIQLLDEPMVVLEAAGGLTFGAMGLQLSTVAVRLPGSRLVGDVAFGPERPGEPWTVSLDMTSQGWGDLADLQWIDPRIPEGRFRGRTVVRAAEGIDVDFRSVDVELAASRLHAEGRASFGDALTLAELRLTANPLVIDQLEPWLGRTLPYDGFLSGQVTLGGSARALSATGRVTLVAAGMGGAPTTADFSGTVHLGEDPGATDLDVLLDPLNYRLLEPYWADARVLGGGRARLELNGSVSEELQVVADVRLGADSLSTSRWVGRGAFTREADAGWLVDLSGDLSAPYLEVFTDIWPELELRGGVSGPIRASGTLDSMSFGGELASGEGTLAFDGSADLRSLGSSYRLDAEAISWPLSDLTTRVPAPAVVSASVSLEGRGFAPDSLAGSARVTVLGSRIGQLRVDSVSAVLRAAEGVVTADTLVARASGTRVEGSGSLGLVEGAYGEASFSVEVASLLDLRPVVMGDSILVRDGLSPLEQDLLRVRGIDPDTLPDALDVRMEGSAFGVADLRGSVRSFDLGLALAATQAAYRHDSVDSLTVTLSAGDLPATFGEWLVDARAHGVEWGGRQFEQVALTGNMSQRRGEGTLDVRRRLNERYFANGAFAVDSLGGQVELEEASAQINALSWALSYPARVAWTETSLSLDSLEIARVGEDPVRVSASGTLTRGGDSDFRLELDGFPIEDALQIAQREDIDVAGQMDLSLTVLGPAEAPVINTLFQIEDPRFRAMSLARVNGSLEYADRSSVFRVDGWSSDRNVVSAEGTLPLDLALTDVAERQVDVPMSVRVTADSLQAAIALAYLSALEDVRGTLSADFEITGTTAAPTPSGTVYLEGGAWTLEALGVRHEGVSGEVLLRPDRTLDVALSTTRSGRSTVEGVVTLEPLSDPALDLVVSFDRFQAVDRRDMEGMISGAFRLGGTYRLPVAEGTLRVDQGTLFVEEFRRAATVVDLTDPLLYADGFAVDTTVFVSQPLLAGLRNPFLDNLRVDIDLSVPRDVWLRSDEMNVEMGGDLLVRYDRGLGDLVLVGELQALRGSYLMLGRTFEVSGGTVAFLGQAGVNPTLDIEARSRIRRRDGDPLDVVATVQGTLVQPLVTLTSEEAGLAQSDLVSYIVFGRAGAELGTGGASAGGGLGQDLGGGFGTYAAGTFANQLGAAVAQELGLDYLAVSQGDIYGDAGAFQNFLSTAQLEVGLYLGPDVFLVAVVSRPTGTGTETDERNLNFLRGLRVELALTDSWFVEGFVEDRLLRSGTGGLGVSGLDGEMVGGLLFFREWGYGSEP